MAAAGGFRVIFNHIPKLIASIEAESRSAPKKVADKIASDARARAPVATGALRSSITSVSMDGGKTAEVQVGVDYAPYVEYGTHKMAAQPFLYPATLGRAEELLLEIVSPIR